MYEDGVQVKLGGREYDMVFTLAALLAIKKRYGGVQDMSNQFNGPEINEWDDEALVKEKSAAQTKARGDAIDELPWLMAILISQGEMLKDPKAAPITPEYVALRVLPKDMDVLLGAAMKALAIGLGTEQPVSTEKKDPVLEELEGKNAVSAEGT